MHRHRRAAAVAAPGQLMEALDPVQHVLDGAHLRPGSPAGACTVIQEMSADRWAR